MFSFFTSSGLSSLLLAVLTFLAVVHALCLPCQVGQYPLSLKTPSSPSRRGVYSPPITSPDASTRWTKETEVTVTWCGVSRSGPGITLTELSLRSTSDMPESVTNSKGKLLLGYLEPGSSNEHLDLGKCHSVLRTPEFLTIGLPFQTNHLQRGSIFNRAIVPSAFQMFLRAVTTS